MDSEIYDNPQNFDPSRWNVSPFFFNSLGINPFEPAYKLLWIIGIKTVLNLSRVQTRPSKPWIPIHSLSLYHKTEN